MNFRNLSIGGKIVLISILISIISIFLPWAKVDGITQMGYDQQVGLFLIFYIYPLKMLLANLRPKIKPLKAQIIFSLFGLAIMFYYIISINTSMYGAYIMLASFILEIIGCYKAIRENNHIISQRKESFR